MALNIITGRAAGPGLLVISSPLLIYPLTSVSQVVGEFPSSPRPCPCSPGTLSSSGVTPEVFSPQGNYFTPRVSMPLGDSTPPSQSLAFSPVVFCHSRGLAPPPLCSPLQRTRRPDFHAGQHPFSFSCVSPRGSLPIPPHTRPWR